MIGAMVGFPLVVGTLFIGSVLGALAGGLLLIIRRRGRRDYIPFGSGMCLATMLMLVLSGTR